jgi:hypothetical protein
VAKWFGPILQPCGCCYEEPPPPPPPPCACANTECFEEGELNWRSLKFEVEIDNYLRFFTQYKNLICQPGCNRVYGVRETEFEWSGLSAFNGTYDIPYYVYDDYTEAWIEGDPIAIPCGVWFYPTITANITLTRRNAVYAEPADIYGLYTDSSCSTQILSQTDTFPVHLETRSGHVWTDAAVPSFPGGFFMGPGTPVSAFYPSETGTRTGDVFACSSISSSSISQTLTSPPLTPQLNVPTSPLPRMGWMSASGSRFIGVARTFYDSSLISSLYSWSQYPYGGPGIPISSTQCTLDIEEGVENYTGFVTVRESTARVQCNPFNPGDGSYQPGSISPQKWRVESSAWNQRFKMLVNAP